jgi:hypothetical protein
MTKVNLGFDTKLEDELRLRGKEQLITSEEITRYI